MKILPSVITFLIVLGGIYRGFFSAIEASAVGAFMAFICALIFKETTLYAFKNAFLSTVKICVMVYIIVVGAMIFSHLIFLSGLKEFLVSVVMDINAPAIIIYMMIMAIVTVLGCLMDVLALLVICVPIFLPIAEAIGLDPILFGIIMIIQKRVGGSHSTCRVKSIYFKRGFAGRDYFGEHCDKLCAFRGYRLGRFHYNVLLSQTCPVASFAYDRHLAGC